MQTCLSHTHSLLFKQQSVKLKARLNFKIESFFAILCTPYLGDVFFMLIFILLSPWMKPPNVFSSLFPGKELERGQLEFGLPPLGLTCVLIVFAKKMKKYLLSITWKTVFWFLCHRAVESSWIWYQVHACVLLLCNSYRHQCYVSMKPASLDICTTYNLYYPSCLLPWKNVSRRLTISMTHSCYW